MSIQFRLPNITATNDAGKLAQVQAYMYQLVEQLNWAMKNVVTETSVSTAAANGTVASPEQSIEQSQATFNAIKALIIKSADIVNAYYDKINAKLEGVYVAESDFGVYAEQTSQEIAANSTAIEQFYTDLQQIVTDIENAENSMIAVHAHIRSGLLFYDDSGAPVYGLEIGQRTEIDGVESFNKYAQFTANKLAFFDQNGYEVAYISDRKLFIADVEITGSLIMGGFKRMVVPGRGVVTKWIGG